MQTRVLAFCFFLAAVLFCFDSVMPLGIATSLTYIAVIFLVNRLPDKKFLYLFGVLTSLLTLGVFFTAAPSETPIWEAVANRLLSLFAIWATISILIQNRNAQVRLFSILKASPHVFCLIKRNHDIVYVNDHLHKLFSYQAVDVMDRPVESLIPDRLRPKFQSVLDGAWKSLRVGETLEAQSSDGFVGKTRQGSEFSVSIRCSKIRTVEGEHLLISFEDISHIKRAEAIKDEFLSMVSHET